MSVALDRDDGQHERKQEGCFQAIKTFYVLPYTSVMIEAKFYMTVRNGIFKTPKISIFSMRSQSLRELKGCTVQPEQFVHRSIPLFLISLMDGKFHGQCLDFTKTFYVK